MKILRPLSLLWILSLFLAACAAPAGQASSSRLVVVTSVSPIANILANIGGDRIQLTGIIPEGSDSHTFEPAPSDAKTLARADLILLNGLKLEEPTLELAKANLKPGAEIVLLGDQTLQPSQYIYDFSFPKENGSPNPHLWMNPLYALRYAEIARDTFTRRDPAGTQQYSAAYAAFKDRIEALDQAIQAAVATIPPANRKLLTYHDSFAYFAPRYGLSVIGAIQPSSFAEPSAREIAGLVEQIKREHVPAIFGSEVFPSPVLDLIAKESGAQYVDKLRDDELPGKPGEANHSYLGMMVEDVSILARALGGDPAKLAGFDTRSAGQ